MSRAAILPLQVGVTPPESLAVLQQRLRVAEEQVDELVQGMESLGVSGKQLLELPRSVKDPPFVSPAHVGCVLDGGRGRQSFLWRNCETLVSWVCRLESLLHSLKLTTFRLETERELNSAHSASLMEQLSALRRESEEEQRAAKREVTRVQDRLHQACQDRAEALEKVKCLAEALEAATSSKVDVVMEAEKVKEVMAQMNQKLLELNKQLSQEASCNSEMKQSQGALLQRVQKLEKVIENERRQKELLEADCRSLCRNRQEAEQRWQKEAERVQQFEEQCQQLQQQADRKESLISQLTGELKKLLQENARMLKKSENLKASAFKAQVLNDRLEAQCTALNAAVRSMTIENAQLRTDHRASLKVEQERVDQQLREQDLLLDAARRNIQEELKEVQSEKLRLQGALCSLQAEHTELQRSSVAALANAVTQRELLESTVDTLRGELATAVTSRDSLRKEMDSTQAKMSIAIAKHEVERSSLEMQLVGLQVKMGTLEEENKVLRGKLAVVDQVEALRTALELAGTDNKKLAQSLKQALLAYSELQGRLCRAEENHQELTERAEVTQLTKRLKTLKAQLRKERDSGRRAAQKVAEVKETLKDVSRRSDNLSVENGQLKEKVRKLEKVVFQQKARMAEQKSELKKHVTSTAEQWNSQRVKDLEAKLKAQKNEYQKHNYEQSQLVMMFQSEVLSLQRDLRVLSSSQQGALQAVLLESVQNRCLRSSRSGPGLSGWCISSEKLWKTNKRAEDLTDTPRLGPTGCLAARNDGSA